MSVDDELLQQLNEAGVVAREIPWGDGKDALELTFASGRTFVVYANALPGAGVWIDSDEVKPRG
jgi:hypothetical protein